MNPTDTSCRSEHSIARSVQELVTEHRAALNSDFHSSFSSLTMDSALVSPNNANNANKKTTKYAFIAERIIADKEEEVSMGSLKSFTQHQRQSTHKERESISQGSFSKGSFDRSFHEQLSAGGSGMACAKDPKKILKKLGSLQATSGTSSLHNSFNNSFTILDLVKDDNLLPEDDGECSVDEVKMGYWDMDIDEGQEMIDERKKERKSRQRTFFPDNHSRASMAVKRSSVKKSSLMEALNKSAPVLDVGSDLHSDNPNQHTKTVKRGSVKKSSLMEALNKSVGDLSNSSKRRTSRRARDSLDKSAPEQGRQNRRERDKPMSDRSDQAMHMRDGTRRTGQGKPMEDRSAPAALGRRERDRYMNDGSSSSHQEKPMGDGARRRQSAIGRSGRRGRFKPMNDGSNRRDRAKSTRDRSNKEQEASFRRSSTTDARKVRRTRSRDKPMGGDGSERDAIDNDKYMNDGSTQMSDGSARRESQMNDGSRRRTHGKPTNDWSGRREKDKSATSRQEATFRRSSTSDARKIKREREKATGDLSSRNRKDKDKVAAFRNSVTAAASERRDKGTIIDGSGTRSPTKAGGTMPKRTISNGSQSINSTSSRSPQPISSMPKRTISNGSQSRNSMASRSPKKTSSDGSKRTSNHSSSTPKRPSQQSKSPTLPAELPIAVEGPSRRASATEAELAVGSRVSTEESPFRRSNTNPTRGRGRDRARVVASEQLKRISTVECVQEGHILFDDQLLKNKTKRNSINSKAAADDGTATTTDVTTEGNSPSVVDDEEKKAKIAALKAATLERGPSVSTVIANKIRNNPSLMEKFLEEVVEEEPVVSELTGHKVGLSALNGVDQTQPKSRPSLSSREEGKRRVRAANRDSKTNSSGINAGMYAKFNASFIEPGTYTNMMNTPSSK